MNSHTVKNPFRIRDFLRPAYLARRFALDQATMDLGLWPDIIVVGTSNPTAIMPPYPGAFPTDPPRTKLVCNNLIAGAVAGDSRWARTMSVVARASVR